MDISDILLIFFCCLGADEGDGHLREVEGLVSTEISRDYHQSFQQPGFCAERKKGALSGGFLLIFLCAGPKSAPNKSAPRAISGGFLLIFLCLRLTRPQKIVGQALVSSDTLVSAV